MALVVSEIAQEARELHPAFREQFTPGPLVRRFLSRYHRQLVSKVSKVNPDALDAEHTVSLPLGSFPTESGLPAAHSWRRAHVVYPDGRKSPFYLVAWDERQYTRYFPAGTITGDTLHLLGEEAEWTSFDSIVLGYVPIPDPFTDATGAFVVPDSAQSVLVSAAADFLAGRAASRKDGPAVDVGRYRADFQHDEREFLREIANLRRANENQISERW